MKWAFVDYENVGSLEALKGSDYARILVFCGPKNSKFSLDDVPTAGTCRFALIRVTTVGSNDLDFTLLSTWGNSTRQWNRKSRSKL